MLERSISLTLIAAVIACPMWCGNGVCYACRTCDAVDCGRGEEPPASCPLHRAVDCACNGSSQESDPGAPSRCPDKGVCQGVCGGAVIEKLGQLDGIEASLIFRVIGSDGSMDSLLAQRRAVYAERFCNCGSVKNHGRFVRTLHSSFLC